ncbi:hypothetical protein F5Y19DRAFT_27354 [Xylariaceae sp. FL1651]|nr:hypothetical protein F5Y19DRAFT_27354 [Xylariaceae sp. FL1651]
MSGLEPLVALSLACNVLQIISCGRETYSIYGQIKESGTAIPELASRTTSLLKLTQQLDEKINHISPQNLTREQEELQSIAQQCLKTARKLSKELEKSNDTTHTQFSRLKETFKAHWRKAKIDGLEKEMEGLQNILQSRLLYSISSQSEAAALRDTKGFENLDETIRRFITQYSIGRTELSDLIQQSIKTAVLAVTTEGITTRAEISKELEQFTKASNNVCNQNQLIGSLRFTGMNERRSQIKIPYSGTFKWILYPDNVKNPLPFPGADWDNFTEWLRLETTCNSNIYWVSGKAGSGKSTLMKYLLESEDTRTILETPNSCGYLIVSYFFAISGSYLQHSIKGMLCSLLSQVILVMPNLAIFTAKEFPGLSEKWSESDWSEKEILTILQRAMFSLHRPACLFIDGLDELDSHDDVLDLLDIIRQLSAFPSVKLCVSGRPENIFTREFHAVPKLRLQDLTKSDILHYVAGYLTPLEALIQQNSAYQVHSTELQHLIYSISVKSEGVFLWVYVVVRQLRRAIIDGDAFELLKKRLNLLPSNLTDLFDQMWSRHNENEELYRVDAACCFNLLLSSRPLAKSNTSDTILLPSKGGVSLLDFSLGLRQDICASILDDDHRPNSSYIVDACKAARLQIETRCIGFLEISKNERSLPLVGVPGDHSDSNTCDSGFIGLLEFANLTVNFMHRTAKEYLICTEQGKRILQEDKTTQQNECSKLFMASLARSALVISEQPTRFASLMATLQELSQSVPEESLNALLRRCQALWQTHRVFWFETGCEEYSSSAAVARYIYHCVYGNQNPLRNVGSEEDIEPSLRLKFPLFYESGRFDFLSWASQYGFSRFVLQAIDNVERTRSVSTEYKSYLLQSASNIVSLSGDVRGHCDLICTLLDKGADPNMLCPYEQSSDRVEGSRPIETFIYALKDRLVWAKYEANDHETLSKTLKKMVEKAHLNKLTFSTHSGFIDGRLGITKRTMRQEMLLSQSHATLYLSINIRMLLLDLLDEIQTYRPEISHLYLLQDRSEPVGDDVSDVVLVANPSYYPNETTNRTISRWTGRVPTKQERDAFRASSQTSARNARIVLDRIPSQGALEVNDRIEHDVSLDIDDIQKFLVEKGLHEPLDSLDSWSRQFSLDREVLEQRNPNYRKLSSQVAGHLGWRRGRF